MATVTGLTADRMLQIEANSIVEARRDGDYLILVTHAGEVAYTGKVVGERGVDGETVYSWIMYADDASGAGISSIPTGKTHIGIAYNKPHVAPSTTPSDYTWSLIRGAKGERGVDGKDGDPGIRGLPGADGQPLYTWIKYADSINGTGMSDSSVGKEYIGLAYNKPTSVESTTPGDYEWSLFKGPMGVPGQDGEDGQPTYTWIKYGTSSAGAGMSDLPAGKTYIGIAYNKTTETESSTPGDYLWSLIQGVKGDSGSDGKGVTSVIAEYYNSTSSSTTVGGAWSTTAPAWDKDKYIWLRTKTTFTDATTATTTGVNISGESGQDGSDGTPGVSITEVVIWYYLSTSAISLTGGTWVTTTPAWTDGRYMWSKVITIYSSGPNTESAPANITGSKGATGAPGPKGTGVLSIIEQYYSSTSPTEQLGGTWSTVVPTWTNGRYIWTRSKITYTDTSETTTLPVNVTGAQGEEGAGGLAGRGITGVDVMYYSSTSSTALVGGTWQTTAPAWVNGRYMWSKTIVKYTTGANTESTPAVITGAMGSDGISVASVTRFYQFAATIPQPPTTPTPPAPWVATEPPYLAGANKLYFVDRTVMSDASVSYSLVSTASSYEAARAAMDAATLARNEALSRGTDLVTNGTGMLKDNTNFSTLVYVPDDAPPGSTGSFEFVKPRSTEFNTDLIPVSTDKSYLVSVKARQASPGGTSRLYVGLAPIDSQGSSISPQYYYYIAASLTTLAVALKSGDTTATLTDDSGWGSITASYLGIWNWQDPAGRVWPAGTYTRAVPRISAKAGKVLTFSTAYVGPTMPVGTPVSDNRAGGSYMYVAASNVTVPEVWTTYSGTVLSGVHDGTKGAATNQFPPGTAAVKLLFLPNRLSSGSQDPGSLHRIGGISISDAQAAQALAEKAVASITRYFRLATSKPAAPTTLTPGAGWTTTEPIYTLGSTNNVWQLDRVVLANGAFSYSDVTRSEMFETGKLAYAMANGKNKVTRSTATSPSGTGVVGDTWEKWDTLSSGGKLKAFWTWTDVGGGSWIQGSLDPAYLPLIDIGEGTFGSLNGGRLEADTVSAEALFADYAMITKLIADDAIFDGVTANSIGAGFGNALKLSANDVIELVVGPGGSLETLAQGIEDLETETGTLHDNLSTIDAAATEAGSNALAALGVADSAETAAGLNATALQQLQTHYQFTSTSLKIVTPGMGTSLQLGPGRVSLFEGTTETSYWKSQQFVVNEIIAKSGMIGSHSFNVSVAAGGTVFRKVQST